jgi:hypothetical protein
LQEIPKVDDDLRYSIDRLDNLRFAEEEDRSQKLDLDKIRKSSNNSNYTNPNLDGIIKGNVINTPFYSTSSQVSTTFHSTSSQFPQRRINSPTNFDMGFFPPNMYDPQINMIRKLFELNKKRLRKDFMSLKYENRRKEFFATFSEFLRNYIRDKYYKFMNDIQTEVNLFEWFDHYYKPKILTDRNTKPLLQKENINKTRISNTTPPNTPPLTLMTKTHACNSLTTDNMHFTTNQQDKNTNRISSMTSLTPMTSKYQFNDITHLDKKQTILSQYG